MFRSPMRWIAPFCFLALTGCASTSASSLDLLEPQPEQTLRPGDVVELVVWREEDLSGEFLVDRTGHVILPRMGKVDVRQETESSLEDRLNEVLSTELRDAAIDVIVLRRIQVVGAVQEPGLYPMDNTMTVSDALATAGGVNPVGVRGRVELVRDGQRYALDTDRDHTLAALALRSGDALYVPQRHWLLRNYGPVVTAVSSLAGLVAVFISTGIF